MLGLSPAHVLGVFFKAEHRSEPVNSSFAAVFSEPSSVGSLFGAKLCVEGERGRERAREPECSVAPAGEGQDERAVFNNNCRSL